MAFKDKELKTWWKLTAHPSSQLERQQDGRVWLAAILVGRLTDTEFYVNVGYHPGLHKSAFETVAAECHRRVQSFMDDGPDGGPFTWKARPDGRYEVWLALEYFPDVDLEWPEESALED